MMQWMLLGNRRPHRESSELTFPISRSQVHFHWCQWCRI